MMLDDMNVISQRDRSDALGIAEGTPSQLKHTFGLQKQTPEVTIEQVVFTAMGGSALAAEFAKTWPALKVPFIVSKEYTVPEFVNSKTLVIAASYSGNTEESLSALEDARAKGAQVAVIAAGGKLLEKANEYGCLHVQIPEAAQPRMAVFYAFRALVELFIAYGLVEEGTAAELDRIADSLAEAIRPWTKSVGTAENEAKQLALQLVGKTPIVYAGPMMAPAAYKWKISVNENAKNTAWCNTLPEFNHNEFIGWSSHPVEKPFAVIDLVSSFEHERVLKRFEVSDRLLSGMRPKSISVTARGESVVEHLLFLVLFGDFVTIYLGLLNGVDPTPVDLVERFKKELG